MVYLALLLTLQLLSSADGGTPPRGGTPTLSPLYHLLPVFVDSRLPLVEKELLSPARGTGLESLPRPLREILLPVPPNTPSVASGVSVTTSCNMTLMLVQVRRSILDQGVPQSRVKLGTCQHSASTTDYLYFEYDLSKCGTKRTLSNNQVLFSNTLHYDPPTLPGPIRRVVPFTLPVACYYNRYHYSYKIGYKPKIQMRKIFKAMRNKLKFILTARNAQWEKLSPSDQYSLGKPMYFEAEAPSITQDERLYLNLCYATAEKSHTSTPQFLVVNNFGCMVESKESRSRFIPHKKNAVRFTADAFLFKGMTGRLYMHCSMSVGGSTPSATAKSCNYDTRARKWVELYESDYECTCCDSSCNATESKVTKIISSKSWMIEPKVKQKKTPKRKMFSASTTTTTTTTTTKTTRAAPQTTRERIKWSRTLTPEAPRGKTESVVKELEWLYGGGGVASVEVEGEEEQVEGSAVVKAEEVAVPRMIFEEIFGLSK